MSRRGPDTQKKNSYVSGKIAKLRKEGMPDKQAIAVALSYAREKGYNVPPPPKKSDQKSE